MIAAILPPPQPPLDQRGMFVAPRQQKVPATGVFLFRRATASGRPETPHSISLIIPACSSGLDS
jgi:hypothetical protein